MVYDSALSSGGQQMVVTHEGYAIPLHVCDGLYYMDMKPASDNELDWFLHVFFTADAPWNPSIIDEKFLINIADSILDIPAIQQCHEGHDSHVDSFGTMHSLLLAPSHVPSTKTCHKAAVEDLVVMSQKMQHHLPNLDALLPNFGWVSKDQIHTTLEMTTQHYQADKQVPMLKHFRSHFPAMNVCCLPEWYSTDMFISDILACDNGVPGHGGCKLVQIYSGLDSELLSAYPMASESSLPDTLHDFICDYGTMEGLKSDNAKSKTSFTIKDIFHMDPIKDKQLDPHKQHQNPIEHHIQDLKQMMHGIMDCVSCPASFWLLCLLYIVRLFIFFPIPRDVSP